MFKKLCLAAALAVAGLLVVGDTQAEAQHCRYGYGHGGGIAVYAAPSYRSSYRHAVPYRPVYGSNYRGGFGYNSFYGSPYRSYRGGYGFGSPYYGRGTSIGIGRGGISIGIGF
ncbi:MAG: hypothetical protein HKN47_10365 [Pirellulaceae bacterium]|nr:hypothetical protein [Pirellulaceae bacterium]